MPSKLTSLFVIQVYINKLNEIQDEMYISRVEKLNIVAQAHTKENTQYKQRIISEQTES